MVPGSGYGGQTKHALGSTLFHAIIGTGRKKELLLFSLLVPRINPFLQGCVYVSPIHPRIVFTPLSFEVGSRLPISIGMPGQIQLCL